MTETPLTIDPAKAALVVIDYQTGLSGFVPGVEQILPRVTRAIATARAHGVTVANVHVAFEEAEHAAIPTTNKALTPLIGSGFLLAGSPETTFHDEVAPQPGDIVVRKIRNGAFSTTDLDEQLRARGIETVIIAGITTSSGVLWTVGDAADRDYRIVILADACGDGDAEVHDFLLARVLPSVAHIVGVDDLAGLLGTS